MKTTKELREFLGIEKYRRYILTNIHVDDDGLFINSLKHYIGQTFTLSEEEDSVKFSDGILEIDISISNLIYCDYEEIKSVLNEKEKEYLKAVIKPFRDRVESIEKLATSDNDYEYLEIWLQNDVDDNMLFPLFLRGTMYKGMKQNREYTLEELEL